MSNCILRILFLIANFSEMENCETTKCISMGAETEECFHDGKNDCHSADDDGHFWEEMDSSFTIFECWMKSWRTKDDVFFYFFSLSVYIKGCSSFHTNANVSFIYTGIKPNTFKTLLRSSGVSCPSKHTKSSRNLEGMRIPPVPLSCFGISADSSLPSGESHIPGVKKRKKKPSHPCVAKHLNILSIASWPPHCCRNLFHILRWRLDNDAPAEPRLLFFFFHMASIVGLRQESARKWGLSIHLVSSAESQQENETLGRREISLQGGRGSPRHLAPAVCLS